MSTETALRVVHFTDPTCPVAFSAEPVRRRLRWLFGNQLAWQHVMVVLNDGSGGRGGPPHDRVAAARRRLHAQYGMPLDPDAQAAQSATLDASRLVVAARLRAPQLEERVLRALRRHVMAGGDLDRASLDDLAGDIAPPKHVAGALVDGDVEALVRSDMAAAREPTHVARALAHRLGGGGTRYSTPSYRYETPDAAFELVGIHPVDAHDAVIANLKPQLERRPDAASVEEVLAWAGEPLATSELAAVLNVAPDAARDRARDAALFTPAGLDGYWSLRTPTG